MDDAGLHRGRMDRRRQHLRIRSISCRNRLWDRPRRSACVFDLAVQTTAECYQLNDSTKHSAYMEWAKTRSVARFNLATSGLRNVSIRDFPIHRPEMEITGPGGYGYQPLQERIAEHTGAPADCIVAATGTSMANYLAMSVVLNPGDEVLIEQPAYGLFAEIANYVQARPRFFTRPFQTGFKVTADAIRSSLTPKTRLIVLSNLHNPSGALISEHAL